MNAQRHITQSPMETAALAGGLAGRLKPGLVIALHGELGAGKTCFIQGLARAMGVHRSVQSPTYTLVNEYLGENALPLYHIDLYRVRSPDEALGLGLDEYLFGRGVTAIEWAERAGDLIPPDTVHISIQPGDAENERRITIEERAP